MKVPAAYVSTVEKALRLAENAVREDREVMQRLREQGGNGMITADAAARIADDKQRIAEEFGEARHALFEVEEA